MELDLSAVRSFVVAAEEGHLRYAAARLGITQQALSKRLRRLEEGLGVSLFARSTRGVELTPAGTRFLRPARSALEAGTSAVTAARGKERPLHVDVLDDRLAPNRLLRELLRDQPDLPLRSTMRQALPSALPALERGEVDAAFGRVRDLGPRWPDGLDHRLVLLEPLHVAVGPQHQFSTRRGVRMAELAETGVWMSDFGADTPWEGYTRRLAERFGVPLRIGGPVLDERHFVEELATRTREVTLVGAEVHYADPTAVISIPLLDPVPLFPWSLVWRRADPHPAVSDLIRLAGGRGSAYAGDGFWLPEVDVADVAGAS